MLKLGSLKDSSLVKTESSELGKVHETFMQLLLNSKRLKGTAPIFHPDYVTAFRGLLQQGGEIELICTDQVLSKTLQSAPRSGQAELFQKFIEKEQLKIYFNDNLKIALTVTDDIFSMGLFDLTGTYDYNSDLISMNSKAVKWGEDVFSEYLKKSKRLNLKDLPLGVG